MPSWLPGSSKTFVPQAPYFDTQHGRSDPNSLRMQKSRSTTDLREKRPGPPARSSSKSDLPYRQAAPVTPAVPRVPAQYAQSQSSYNRGPLKNDRSAVMPAQQGRALTPPTSDPAESPIEEYPSYDDPQDQPPSPSNDPTAPNYEVPEQYQSPHAVRRKMGWPPPGQPVVATPPATPSVAAPSTQPVYPPLPSPVPTAFTPVLPGASNLRLSDVSYRCELVEGEPGVWEVQMKYKVRLT